MNLKRINKRIFDYLPIQTDILTSKKYYRNENEILETGVIPKGEGADPLRSADNRIAHNFHEILVDEKASYLFTYPVLIDIDNNQNINEKVNEILGEQYTRKMKNQCIEASNAGTSWLHYWIKTDKEDTNVKKFKYSQVPTEQVIPIYSNGLERDLEAIIRTYIQNEYPEDESIDYLKPYRYIEYWTKDNMEKWKFDGYSSNTEEFIDYQNIKHELGEVPFIEFANNFKKQSDLHKYKKLIDLIDRVMSGFANDLDDIQEIIYILENYGGENLAEFMSDLKKYKAVKTENDGTGPNGGVKTLQLEIPVEARKVIIEILEKRIYEAGQGLQQDINSVGNASGVTLKFFYRKLELKSGLLETEFRTSLNYLVKAILKFLGISDYKKITQTWSRNMISNDSENAVIAKDSVGIIPKKIILRNHPWIDDEVEAEKLLKEEEESLYSDYSNLQYTTPVGDDNGEK